MKNANTWKMIFCEGVWNNHGGVEARAAWREEKYNQAGGGGAPRTEGGGGLALD